MLAPICLFTYNRLTETKQTVTVLQQNFLAKESDLFIFSDGAKNESSVGKVSTVREYLKSINGFKSITIYESSENKGLADSIINGVSKIIEKYGKIIVLEDDLITAPNFLDFMNQALDFYLNNKMIQSVNGYSLSLTDKQDDVYFQIRPFSWGWGTWQNRWNSDMFNKKILNELIDSDTSILKQFKKNCGQDIPAMLLDSLSGKNDSWYVRWAFDHFKNMTYSLYPSYSLLFNIGFGETGTHCRGINSYKSELSKNLNTDFKFIPFQPPSESRKGDFLRYFSKRHKILIRLQLLINKEGRSKLIDEIKSRMDLI